MTGAALLEEARAHGVVVYRVGARLRWRSAAPIAPDLLTQLSEHKSELLQVAPDYGAIFRTLTATFGTAEDAAVIEWYAALNGDAIIDEITALERRCERLAALGTDETVYRAAIVALVARMSQIRGWYSAAQGDGTTADVARSPWRLTLVANHPVTEAVRLDDDIEIRDVPKFVAQTLTAIDYVLRQPPRSYPDAAALIRVYLKQLEQVGVVACVESVS